MSLPGTGRSELGSAALAAAIAGSMRPAPRGDAAVAALSGMATPDVKLCNDIPKLEVLADLNPDR
jgi:hypothetical protein